MIRLTFRENRICPEGAIVSRLTRSFVVDAPAIEQFMESVEGNCYAGIELLGVTRAIGPDEGVASCHDWNCGCGHWNGPSLIKCGRCGRTPNESKP